MGAWHGRARLSDAQVRAMRADYEAGLGGYNALGKKYGCGESTVRDIVNYKTRGDA